MTSKTVTVPELAMIAGTRAALGAGIGLLLADRFNPEQRRAVGWTLLAVGAISTLPLAAGIMLGHDASAANRNGAAPSRERELVGATGERGA